MPAAGFVGIFLIPVALRDPLVSSWSSSTPPNLPPGLCRSEFPPQTCDVFAGNDFEKDERVKSRIRNVLVAAAVLIAGVVGLFLPVSVFDGGSSTVGCGNAVTADESGPRAANVTPAAGGPAVDRAIPRPDFVVACDAAISGRRHWALPLVTVGVVGLVVGVLFRGRRGVAPGGV
jgi:hypothetical protein